MANNKSSKKRKLLIDPHYREKHIHLMKSNIQADIERIKEEGKSNYSPKKGRQMRRLAKKLKNLG